MIGEVSSRGGCVEAMTGPQEQLVIQATLPAQEFKAMATIVEGLRGKTSGRIERQS
jgi:hypothetical protein